ncbi:hypothetical protein ACLMJK_009463 [Lecanora helva]
MLRSLLPVSLLFSIASGITTNATLANNVTQFLQTVVKAMGGSDALNNLTSYSYEALTIYRSQTLTQSYALNRSDQSVSAAGSQTMSFEERNATLLERIDRAYSYSDYWIWALPTLTPDFNYSLVVHDGPNGFACFNRGQNSFYADDHTAALGFADQYLTDYLIQQAHQFALPWFIKQLMTASPQSLSVHGIQDPLSGITLQAIDHPGLNLTLIINENLPYMVRSYEQHRIFGNSTSDVIFSNYSSFGSLLLPRRIQTVYNNFNMIEDIFLDNILTNPARLTGFFDADSTNTTSMPPAQSAEYPKSEVHEFFEAGLWGGPFPYNVSDLVIEYPIPSIPAIKSVWIGYADYVQFLIEFEDGFLVTDAPPHRSRIILEWVSQNSDKKITHVVPSHHHHDHAGGVDDYVAAGASLVVPEIAKRYYAKVNGGHVNFTTYTQSQPFILSDGKVQFRSFWHEDAPHAADWTFAMVTAACPTNDTAVALFVADVVDPGDSSLFGEGYETANAVRWDAGYARQWILEAMGLGVPRSATLVGAHGSTVVRNVSNAAVFEEVVGVTGVLYPDVGAESLAMGEGCQ